jgi:hypothetical protein
MREQIYERGSLPEFARERYMCEAATAVAPSLKNRSCEASSKPTTGLLSVSSGVSASCRCMQGMCAC